MASDIPPAWFVEPLFKLLVSMREHTATWGNPEFVVDDEMAVRLGVAPGKSMHLNTPAGMITVRSR